MGLLTAAEAAPDDILRWLLVQGMTARDADVVVEDFALRLRAAGLPLARVHASLSIVHPTARARAYTWTVAGGLETEDISHEREPGAFEASPFGRMLADGVSERHWLLGEGEHYAAFDAAARAGGRDYLALLFPAENRDFPALRGVGVTFSAERAAGLDAAERRLLAELAQALAVVILRIALRDIMVALMDAYVGWPTSRRILNGEVRRGAGETIDAALVLADLSGFTAVADVSGPGLIERLDEHLEAMAGPVEETGGAVLKFMGDGMLAAFPIKEEQSARQACRKAFAAAEEAFRRNAAVNQRRGAEAPIELHAALHRGAVFYGNVGSRQRLDFTVIGSAVNELSRIEGLCRPLGRRLLMSARVARKLAVPPVSVGRHRLRGIDREFELFSA